MSAPEADLARTGTPARAPSPGRGLVRTGAAILVAVAAAAILAPLIAGWGPTEIDVLNFLEPPGPGHPFGTDANGMDVFSRTLHAARLDLGVAVAAVTIAVICGTGFGLAVGYAGGWADELAMRTLDIVQAIPVFVLALTVAAVFGTSLVTLTIALGLINAAPYARLMRSEVRALREHTFIEAAECAGNSRASILFRHLLPNALTPVLVIAPLNCGWVILMLAGLSFVGLGVQVPQAEWGAMISAGAGDIVGGRWWTTVFPGLALFLAVLGFNLLGEGLQARAGRR